MKFIRVLTILVGVIVILACFLPWIRITNPFVEISGFVSTRSEFGKPGILHCFFSGICILLLLLNKGWSLRLAFFLSVFNIVWAFRNFYIIGSCRGGICPDKLPALYALLVASIFFTIGVVLSMRKMKVS